MAFLSAAVIALGVLGVVNLVLTLVTIRWMRRKDELLSRQAQWGLRPRMAPGTKALDFTATLLAGGTRSLADLTGAASVLAFFSPHCALCRKELPEFIELAHRIPGGPAQVLAVLRGTAEDVAEYAQELNGVAAVTVEPGLGPVARALSVVGYPTFYILDESGVVQASGAAVRNVAALAPA